MSGVAGLAEVVLWVRDIEAALHFYRDMFGLEIISPPELPNKFLRAGEGAAAYAQAGIGPDELNAIELHDAMAPAELMLYERLGLCAPGEGPKLIDDGTTTLRGRVVGSRRVADVQSFLNRR